MPGNVTTFLQYFEQFANYDFIPVEGIISSALYFPESEENLPVNFESAGYDSSYLTLNLGLSLFTLLLHVFLFVLYLVLKQLAKLCPKVSIAVDKLGGYLFWNGTLRIFMELYMEVTLLTFLNLKALKWEKSFAAVNVNGVLVIVMTVAILAVPITLIILAACRYKTWSDDSFQKKIGTVINDLD